MRATKSVVKPISGCYNKRKKRTLKIMGKFLSEAGGFRVSRKRIMEREIEELREGKPAKMAEPRIGEVKEFGLSDLLHFIYKVMKGQSRYRLMV